MSLGQLGPNIGSVGAAQGAALRIWEVIDRTPGIDVYAPGGLAPAAGSVVGRLEFRDVTFAYPSRPDQPVLRRFNLTVEPGTQLALVGPSGSGKSTLTALLMRLYDPQEGAVLLDGVDLREYNVAWLRSRFGVVQQEPQLFNATVRENIAMGRPGAQPSAEEVTAAATAALAHGFVSRLPAGYETMVTGVQLSGGEKQRVAIARVILRNPDILM
jgi:ABC-type multidrug transport system fused ATPase/permease subunit